MQVSPDQDRWYEQAFSTDYLRIYRHRDHREAAAAVDALLDRLHLPPGARCLDLCCGFGRHLVRLRERRLDAVGVDLSAALLTAAAEQPALRGRLVRGDMRRLPFATVFDYVFSFFTSFGYFAEDEANLEVLAEIARVLRPGGGVLLDYLNAPHVVAHLKPADARQFPGFSLRQRRWIDTASRSVNKELIIEDEAGCRRYLERVKLYTLKDFRRFFATVGLRVREVLGSADGAPYGPDTSRLILLGERL